MVMSRYLSIVSLNINGLNAPIKRHRIAEWIRKQDPSICCVWETQLRTKDLHKLKVKRRKKISHANGDKKIADVAILISNKTDFKTKAITRDKESPYKILMGLIQQEDITLINIYTHNIGAPKCIKEILVDFRKRLTAIQWY